MLPLDQALEKAQLKYFDEQREAPGNRTLGRLAGAAKAGAAVSARGVSGAGALPVWHECVATYPGTGQKFRWGHEWYGVCSHRSFEIGLVGGTREPIRD